jgi:hypothetical protein
MALTFSFEMAQLRNHFWCINFCSPKTENMPINFLFGMRSRRLVTEVNFASKSLSFSVLARISLQTSYCTSKLSVSSAWTSWSVCLSQVNAYARNLATLFLSSCKSSLSRRFDVCGLRWKQTRIRVKGASEAEGRPGLMPLQMHPFRWKVFHLA